MIDFIFDNLDFIALGVVCTVALFWIIAIIAIVKNTIDDVRRRKRM